MALLSRLQIRAGELNGEVGDDALLLGGDMLPSLGDRDAHRRRQEQHAGAGRARLQIRIAVSRVLVVVCSASAILVRAAGDTRLTPFSYFWIC